jgi:hypothetical protein
MCLKSFGPGLQDVLQELNLIYQKHSKSSSGSSFYIFANSAADFRVKCSIIERCSPSQIDSHALFLSIQQYDHFKLVNLLGTEGVDIPTWLQFVAANIKPRELQVEVGQAIMTSMLAKSDYSSRFSLEKEMKQLLLMWR